MHRHFFLYLFGLVILLGTIVRPSLSSPALIQNFDGKPGQTAFTLSQFAHGDAAQIIPGGLRLLNDQPDTANAIAFSRAASGLWQSVTAQWTMEIGQGGNGASFALLDTHAYGVSGPAPQFLNWDKPALPHAFAVAFDVHDPPTDEPFNADGNIDHQPEREVALYWDGVEYFRRLSPVEFRTGRPVQITTAIDFVCGGADVTVRIGKTAVYDHVFLPGMMPFECRACFGGRTGDAHTELEISHVRVDWQKLVPPSPKPLTVTAFTDQLNDAKHTSFSKSVDFPIQNASYGRIVATLTLSQPLPAKFDPWDRKAAVYLYDGDGTRYEIIRYITPYHHGYTWQADVSDFRPLLRGRKKIELSCVTYGTGWDVTLLFKFYPGYAPLLAYKVQNLWVGEPEVGNPDNPVSAFFTPKTIVMDTQAAAAKLRITVTGHGGDPNTDNAAEFMPSMRTVHVGGETFSNLLWKTDNGLNPCSPQGGTWKYDRAGWGPGDLVHPWEIGLTPILQQHRGQPVVVRYVVAPYLNINRGKDYAPTHWTESQIIFYKKAAGRRR